MQVTPLDLEDQPIIKRPGQGRKTATGFVRIEQGQAFLYLCWHTVTGGIDRNKRALPGQGHQFPHRLHIRLQNFERRSKHVQVVGGIRELTLDLYSAGGKPLWLQDKQYVPNSDLENRGLHFPFWHDAVKLAMPPLALAVAQTLDEAEGLFDGMILPGDKVLFVGYPFGYSALENPTPVVLTAHVAAIAFKENRHEFLIDRAGAPGMSGSPVFLERDLQLWPVGMYTGTISPDGGGVLSVTSLGACANMIACWSGPLAFVPADSPLLEPVASAALG